MDKKEFLNNILKIHSVAVSTIDKNGLPSSRIIDICGELIHEIQEKY